MVWLDEMEKIAIGEKGKEENKKAPLPEVTSEFISIVANAVVEHLAGNVKKPEQEEPEQEEPEQEEPEQEEPEKKAS